MRDQPSILRALGKWVKGQQPRDFENGSMPVRRLSGNAGRYIRTTIQDLRNRTLRPENGGMRFDMPLPDRRRAFRPAPVTVFVATNILEIPELLHCEIV